MANLDKIPHGKVGSVQRDLRDTARRGRFYEIVTPRRRPERRRISPSLHRPLPARHERRVVEVKVPPGGASSS